MSGHLAAYILNSSIIREELFVECCRLGLNTGCLLLVVNNAHPFTNQLQGKCNQQKNGGHTQRTRNQQLLSASITTLQEITWMDLLGEGFKTKTQQWVNDFKRDSNALPSLVDVLTQSVYIMQMRITRARMAGDPPDILLSPKLGHIRLVEFHRAAEAIEIGYRCADEMGAAITERLR